MNGETISVLTRVSQAVNACVNLPVQTVLGLWSHRMADGEHSLLAAATLPFHNRPWCHVQTHGATSPCWASQGPLLTGHCVPPSPAPNIWCNWENCFIFLWKLCLSNPVLLISSMLGVTYVKISYYTSATHAGKAMQIQALASQIQKVWRFSCCAWLHDPGVYSQLAVTDVIWVGSGPASSGSSQGSTCWHGPGVAAQIATKCKNAHRTVF